MTSLVNEFLQTYGRATDLENELQLANEDNSKLAYVNTKGKLCVVRPLDENDAIALSVFITKVYGPAALAGKPRKMRIENAQPMEDPF